jgi:DcuC family C4-dicarboxylate transporter
MDTGILIIACVIIAAAIWFLIKGADVRLVLFTAGIALASLKLKPWTILNVFNEQMGNVDTIAPICSAMGYAFVLRASGSDREMVRLLIKPIRRVRWLIVPGGCLVGFITNMAITSQTGAAAAVGTILVPLMLAARFHPAIAAATLVLGCSGGGNLMNPGDADTVAIQRATQADMALVLQQMLFPLLAGFLAAVATLTYLSHRTPPETVDADRSAGADDSAPIHLAKALLPPLPIMMIFLMLPGLNLVPPMPPPYDKGMPVSHAMVISTAIVLLVYRREVSARTKIFFEGMGYAYINVISLIITASCFIQGMKQVGLIEKLVSVVTGNGLIARAAAEFFPFTLGVLSGSGMGPSVAFSQAVLPGVAAINLIGSVNLGVMGAIGASFGRTMSPVAAVVIFTASFINVKPLEIVIRVAPALAVALAAALLASIMRG